MIMHALLLLFCSIVVCVLLCLLLVCSIDLLLQFLLLCIAKASGMPCSSVRLQGFTVHGKTVHKWHRIATTAIEGSRLGRQQNKLTPTGCKSTEAVVLTVARLEVSKWKVLRWVVSLG